MNYIEIYTDQFDYDFERRTVIYNSDYFKEYFDLYRYLNGVMDSDIMIQYHIEQLIDEMDLKNYQKLTKYSLKIISTVNGILNDALWLSKNHQIKGVIILFGDGSIDGHGIIINGEEYVVIDIYAILNAKEHYNFKSFVYHEMLHPVHYHSNPEFYFKNCKTTEEQYFKRLFSEGIATYLSDIELNEPIEDVYWLGYLKKDKLDQWIIKAEALRIEIGEKIEASIKEDALDTSVYYQLFSVVDADDFTFSRIGYYYGHEIVKQMLERLSIEELLKMTYAEAAKQIRAYFV